MGYLGKISAVVSVNTGDFAGKLNRCKGDVESFAASTMRSMANASRSSAKSFGSIYTEVQKLERALRAASTLKLDFTGLKGFEGKGLQEAVDQMRQMHSIASQLSAPLSKVVASVDAMSDAIKSTLHGAMVQAQADVEHLQTKMQTVGSVTAQEFEEAERKVRSFAAAAKMAAEATQGAASMGGGSSFRFKNPGLSDEFNRGGQLFGKVNALPAGRVTSELVKLIDLQKDAAQEAVRLTAAMASSPSQAAASGLAAAQKSLESINDSIEKVIRSYADMDAAAANASLVAENVGAKTEYSTDISGIMAFRQREASAKQASLVAGNVGAKTDLSTDISGYLAFQKREKDAKEAAAAASAANKKSQSEAATLLRLEQSRLQVMTGQSQSVAQLDSQYASILSRVEKLSASQRASVAATIAANAGMVEYAISSGTDADVASVQGEVAAIESAVSAAEALDAQQKAAKKSADDLRDSLSKIGDSIGTPAAPIDQAREAIDRMNAAVDKIKDPAKKAKAAGIAAGIRKDIETEVAISAATGSAPAGSVISAAAKKANSLADAADAVNNKKTSKDIFGDVVGSRASQMDQVKSKIKGIQSELEKLPVTVQTKFAPELVKVRDLYMKLTPASTRAEIEAAAKAAKLLGDSIQRTAQAQKFSGSFANFLDDTSAKKYEAELNAVQSKMAAVGATASGPTAQAIGKYRAALEKAAMAGTLGSDATRDSMQDLIAEIEKAVVAEGKLTAAQAKAVFGGIKREGDIGRMGGDKVGLALNQAAFAIDDFMSSTGGIEMKIRAISNNLSQLGFVVGGTKGLFAALGVTIAAQATIALMKFSAGGVTSEDRAKALNDAIAKQKSLVDELARAYSSLSKEMSVSAAAEAGVRGAASLGTVGAANQSNRMGRLTGVSQSVVEGRAMEAAIQKLIEAVTNVGVMIAKQQQLRLTQARTSVEESRARAFAPANPEELQSLRGRRRALSESLNRSFVTRALETVGVPVTFNTNARKAAEELAEVEAAIRAAEDAIVQAADQAAYAIVAGSTEGRGKIAYAQAQIADAIAAGVPGVLKFQSSLDALAFDMGAAMTAMIEAAKEESPERRKSLTEQAQSDMADVNRRANESARRAGQFRLRAAFASPLASEVLSQLDRSSGNAAGRANLVGAVNREQTARGMFDIQQSNVAQATSEVARIRAAGDARVREAGKAADEAFNNKRFAENNADKLGEKEVAKARQLFDEAEAAEKREKAAAARENKAAEATLASAEAARNKAQADVEAAVAASRVAAAFEQAAIDIGQFLARTRKIGEGGVNSAEQAADIAQRAFAERPSDENRQARDAAERRLIDTREKEATLRASLDAKTREMAGDKDVRLASRLIEDREKKIRELQETAAAGGLPLDPREVESLQNDITAARAERDRLVFEGTAPERAAMDEFARNEEKQRQAEAQRAEGRAFGREARAAERARVRQGREDAMTSRDRQKLDAIRGAEDMAAAAGAIGTAAERKAFAQQYYDNRKKEVLQSGPMGQAADERFNAMFPGARRVGIDASDAATSEGSRELNRLLRGDDANKDMNFAEMQRQTELLSDIRDAVQANTGIGVIDR